MYSLSVNNDMVDNNLESPLMKVLFRINLMVSTEVSW